MERLYRYSDKYKFIQFLKERTAYYLVCIDIINFKSINDEFSFYNGDILLSEIVEYVESLSSQEFKLNVCRYESNILMIMVEANDEADMLNAVNEIVNYKYKYHINFRGGYKKITDSSMLEVFLESITYVVKSPKYIIDKSFDNSFELSNDIEKYSAIKKDIMANDSSNFKLVYQPKISNRNKNINSCEVLSRWIHPVNGEVGPSEFLCVIESLDKEVEFDLMIIEKACSELSKEKNLINKFSINISTKSIVNSEYTDKIYEIVKKYGIAPKNITLEILEDICEGNYVSISDNIDKLVKLGFNISIDDFGTGYSSYCRLAQLNFSEVKIAKEFLSITNKNKKILSGIVSLCRTLNCEIVIEGIETEDNVKLAEELEIDYIQGYYYSKPLDKIAYKKFVKDYCM